MRVPDREKQRREYLRKKARTATKLSVGGILIGLMTLLQGLSLIFIPVSLIGLLIGVCFPDSHIDTHWYSRTLVICLLALPISFLIVHWGQKLILKAEQETIIPYVPPVTPEMLSADEVLVRGSQEPIQEQNTLLLRAAGERVDVPAEELLRSSNGAESD